MYQSNSYEYLEHQSPKELLICKDDKEALQIRDVAVLLKYDTFVLPDLRVSVVRRSEANRARSTTGLTLQQRRPALFDESSIRGSTLVA